MRFCVFLRRRDNKYQHDTVGIIADDQVFPIHQFFTAEHVDHALCWEHKLKSTELAPEQPSAIDNLLRTVGSGGLSEHFSLYSGLQLFPFALYTRLHGLLPGPADFEGAISYPLNEVELLPLSWLFNSLRDFYAFEGHVKTARGNRGLEVPPEWYQFPVFYFSNHRAIIGHEAELTAPAHGNSLDYELEIAAIIGMECRDVTATDADQVIAGYTVMNDWSLRDLQREEVKVGLGPAKGKDFATSLGPYLVTLDELADRRSAKGYNLTMVARVNGVELSRGNWQDIHYSFGEMIARASQGVTLFPGDVLGSGTVGTGCILELTPEVVAERLGRAKGWLTPGDEVELEVERFGVLRNRVR